MPLIRTALLAGASALAVAGLAGLAQARTPQTHVLTIQLPGGGMEQVRYTGAIPPQVVLQPMPAPMPMAFAPMFRPDSPFAMLDRISAEMDQQAMAMMREVAAMQRGLPSPDQLIQPGLAAPPPGGAGYGFIADLSGRGVCTQSVSITVPAGGGAPHVVRHASGDCGHLGRGVAPAAQPTAPARVPGMIEVRTPVRPAGQPAYAGLVHPVAAWRD